MSAMGRYFIGVEELSGEGETFRALDPRTGKEIGPVYHSSSLEDVETACALAEDAFHTYSRLAPETRAKFLDRIAEEIEALGDELIDQASLETGLPYARIEGERNRTVLQLRLFANLLRDGAWMDAQIVPADTSRLPAPRPDLRRQFVGVGPVAVFGASNFPLAYSVAGGDTASALAAGCPVVVKGHPAHPGTSELVARAIQNAIRSEGLDSGTFSLLMDAGIEIGGALVANKAIQSVGFTGSLRGGTALMKIANARKSPIPVHAEMGSTNPVFLMPGALEARSEDIANGFVGSVTMSAGQFCTNPGIVVFIDGPASKRFLEQLASEIPRQTGQTMLTPGIHDSYSQSLERLTQHHAVEVLARGQAGETQNDCIPTILTIAARDVSDYPDILEENFGSSSVMVKCTDTQEMLAFAKGLEGQLTASVHYDASDIEQCRELLPILERKAGRIVANGWPTGVEVNAAIVHGGPYPSSSDGRTTSVGPLAIQRFLRPIAYQNFSQELLPAPLQDSNPWGVHQVKS